MQSILLRQIMARETLRLLEGGSTGRSSDPEAALDRVVFSLCYRTEAQREARPITADLRRCAAEAGFPEGTLTARVAHVGCGLMVCEPGGPPLPSAASELLLLSNQSVTLAVRAGRLILPRWQEVTLAEWNGPREERRIEVIVTQDAGQTTRRMQYR